MSAAIKKDDVVIVIAGKERFARKTGKVLRVFPGRGKALVQGLNLVKRHTKPSQKNQQGGIVEKEAPIDISNLQLYCSACKRGVRTGTTVLQDGRKVRACKRCGESLDKG